MIDFSIPDTRFSMPYALMHYALLFFYRATSDGRLLYGGQVGSGLVDCGLAGRRLQRKAPDDRNLSLGRFSKWLDVVVTEIERSYYGKHGWIVDC